MAQQLGATHIIQVNPQDHPEYNAQSIRKIVPVGVDFALDTSGNKNALRSAFESLKSMGVAGLIGGSNPGTKVEIDMLTLLNGKVVRGIIQGDSVAKVFLPQLIELWQNGRFPFDKLITYYDGLNSLNKAVEDTHAGQVIKAIIRL